MLEKLIIKTRQYLETNYMELNLPFIHQFPLNCCEITSLLLGKIIIDEYPMKEVYLAKPTNTSKYEMHFWIEVGNSAFDITADQFDEIKSVVIGKLPEIITQRFDSVERLIITKVLEINDFATRHFDELERISIEIRRKT